jgi:hypothetical protein
VKVSFIGGGNRRKPQTCIKSLANSITKCRIEYTSRHRGRDHMIVVCSERCHRGRDHMIVVCATTYARCHRGRDHMIVVWRKPQTCIKSLANSITKCRIEYTSP